MLSERQMLRLGEVFNPLRQDPGLRQALHAAARAAELPAGQHICAEQDLCHHLALVLSGTARVYKLAESGREITLYRVGAGECCILTASCILSRRPFPAFAVSETPLEALLVPAPQVVQWMTEQQAWRDYIWDLLASRLADVISLVEEVAFRRLDERLAEYLLGKAAQSPELHVTHQQIATDLGTSREVVSRLLKDFEARGLVRLGRGVIGLEDPGALRLPTPRP
jgi:CRP/FNR family transcriptional regulator